VQLTNGWMWVDVGILGGKACFEIREIFEPSNDGVIVSGFHVE